ncbi:MAG TPA: replicative DNA helicase [bacterium]|nr:replicative DNA helicase [bacterium]
MDRVPPHNLEAERAVLAAVLLENQALVTVMEMLEPDDFYLDAHRVIFSSMQEMFNKGMPVDLITLADHLQATARLEQVGGPAAVSALGGLVSTAANVGHWAGIVKDKSLLRRLVNETTGLITEAYGEPEEVEEFLDRAEGKIIEISARQTKSTYQPIATLVNQSFRVLEKMYDGEWELVGVPSGFKDLDKLTTGFQKGDLIIIAGRPSMGKTALAIDIILHAAVEAEKTVAFFSLEMGSNQVVMRMLSSIGRINSNSIRMGNVRPLWKQITNAAGTLGQAKIFVDDSSSLSGLEVKAKARRIKAEHGLDLVVVDYLQLLRGSGFRKGRDSREQEIAEISRSLKGMAKELDIPVIALSQLNRAPEAREKGEPRLSDLRESGSLEQDADLVMLIHRPGVYEKKEEGHEADDRLTRLKIEKQRNGPTGVVDLVFIKEYTRFEAMEGRYDESAVPGDVPF